MQDYVIRVFKNTGEGWEYNISSEDNKFGYKYSIEISLNTVLGHINNSLKMLNALGVEKYSKINTGEIPGGFTITNLTEEELNKFNEK